MRHRGTVAQHGLRYRFNFLAGQPYWREDEYGEQYIAGYYLAEPRWDEGDLTKKQRAEFDAFVAEQMLRPENAGHSEMELRYLLLDWEGIEHTHREGKPILDYRPAYGYECAMCKGWIVAKDPGDAPFHGGPLNGQWLVTNGARVVRVPLVTPLSLATEPTAELTFSAAEYRRGRDGAYYIDRQTLP